MQELVKWLLRDDENNTKVKKSNHSPSPLELIHLSDSFLRVLTNLLEGREKKYAM